MFGQDDNQQQQGSQDWQQPADQTQAPQEPSNDIMHDGSLESPSTQEATPVDSAVAPQAQNDWQQPNDQSAASDWSAPAVSTDDNAALPADQTTEAPSDLIDIKQKALNELSPLLSHLEQTPEEKFKTTMMMIQASDNRDLVPEAYAAAKLITDEKAKAQSLLDIVNEINYFTQHKS